MAASQDIWLEKLALTERRQHPTDSKCSGNFKRGESPPSFILVKSSTHQHVHMIRRSRKYEQEKTTANTGKGYHYS